MWAWYQYHILLSDGSTKYVRLKNLLSKAKQTFINFQLDNITIIVDKAKSQTYLDKWEPILCLRKAERQALVGDSLPCCQNSPRLTPFSCWYLQCWVLSAECWYLQCWERLDLLPCLWLENYLATSCRELWCICCHTLGARCANDTLQRKPPFICSVLS